MTYKVFKRICDLCFSFFLLLLLLPLLLFISLLILISSPGPIFYPALRAGLNNRAFRMFKFRSMVVNAESMGGFSTALNDPRFTPLGRFLRKYKLDELPQLLNVLIGDMSFVGPRPQVFYYTNKYTPSLKKILTVSPGITDLASIYFSDMDSVLGSYNVDTKYELEIEPVKNTLRLRYVTDCSFTLDILVILSTILSFFGLKPHSTFVKDYFEDI